MTISELKFIVDAGVGKSVENYLIEKGLDVKVVRDINPHMPDSQIIKLAANEDRIIITMDKDFGELSYHSEMKHSGILLLRSEDASGIEKQKIVSEILDKYADKLKHHFCVYQKDKFRIRKIKN